eukprot:TRINITY_DN10198_c0_g1_i2.p1 TRINITY_DN10198_c0_g1~~TRINITY_DN10198_c0_g1_i2.p1  ORF type:complete len:738 (-),score=141.90 TRINITY_DN10198_c0_g1_i2:19-2232(-)
MQFRKKALCQKMFAMLLNWKNASKLDPVIEAELVAKSIEHHQAWVLKNVFNQWQSVIRDYYQQKKSRNESALQFYHFLIVTKYYFNWRQLLLYAAKCQKKSEQFYSNLQRMRLIKIFDAWHYKFHDKITSERKLLSKMYRDKSRKFFKLWQIIYQISCESKQSEFTAIRYYQSQKIKIIFQQLKQAVKHQKELQKKQKQICSNHEKNKLKYYYLHLIENLKRVGYKQRICKQMNLHFIKKFWIAMIIFSKESANNKRCKQISSLSATQKKIQLLKNILKRWQIYSVSKRRDQRILKNLSKIKNRQLLWEFWAKILYGSRQQVKAQQLEKINQIEKQQILIADQQEINQILESELNQLKNDFTDLQAVNSQQVEASEQREAIIEESNQKFAELLETKQKLEIDLEFRLSQISELENQLESAKSNIQSSQLEYEQQVKANKEEADNIKLELYQTSKQIEQKQLNYDEYQRQLIDKQSENEQLIENLNQKIQEYELSIQILSQSIREKELEMSNLLKQINENTEKYNLEQSKVAELEQRIEENQIIYQSQIDKLQDDIQQKESVLERQEEERLRNIEILSELNQEVVKFKCELGILRNDGQYVSSKTTSSKSQFDQLYQTIHCRSADNSEILNQQNSNMDDSQGYKSYYSYLQKSPIQVHPYANKIMNKSNIISKKSPSPQGQTKLSESMTQVKEDNQSKIRQSNSKEIQQYLKKKMNKRMQKLSQQLNAQIKKITKSSM